MADRGVFEQPCVTCSQGPGIFVAGICLEPLVALHGSRGGDNRVSATEFFHSPFTDKLFCAAVSK